MKHHSPNIIEILRSTLERLEKRVRLCPDDPALRELRRQVLRLIVELEVERSRRPAV